MRHFLKVVMKMADKVQVMKQRQLLHHATKRGSTPGRQLNLIVIKSLSNRNSVYCVLLPPFTMVTFVLSEVQLFQLRCNCFRSKGYCFQNTSWFRKPLILSLSIFGMWATENLSNLVQHWTSWFGKSLI